MRDRAAISRGSIAAWFCHVLRPEERFMRAFHRDSSAVRENGHPRAAGKLPQFRDVHSLGVASNFARFASPRACWQMRPDDGCSAAFYQLGKSLPSHPGPWEVCRGFSDADRRVINRSTGNWARSVVTAAIPPAQRCTNFDPRRG